ncbi:MAG: FAD-dependent oxidoreductase [Deltaproteobacteria bacterium]|nr:FAD-dependent oxidoreductase [Deltaproteobacteria bacterium]
MRLKSVTIVGGGVLGVTVGLLLEGMGVSVHLVATERADCFDPSSVSPNFASAFPAASIIPHSVTMDGLEDVLNGSLSAFDFLTVKVPLVVRRQWHYEAFEGDLPKAGYLSALELVGFFGQGYTDASPIQRSANQPVAGWRFRTFFVEAPRYMRLLFNLFRELGGTTSCQTVSGPEELLTLPGEVLVVCAGMGSPKILGRREPKHFEQGHLIHLPIGLRDLGVPPASYNYTPLAHIHPNGSGRAMDVYAYPRVDSTVLGGSRLPGVETLDGDIDVEEYSGPTRSVPTPTGEVVQVPSAVIDLNQALFSQLFGIDISKLPMSAVLGRRYRGGRPDAAVSETLEVLGGRPVLSCYGLGGSGVTLSWGLAARLLQRLLGSGFETQHSLLDDPIAKLFSRMDGRGWET